MSSIIDRRLNPKDRMIKNRQKFIERSKEQIKKQVKDAIDSRSITNVEKDKIRVKVKGIDEPTFRKDSKTGDKKYVLPGNKDYVVGDTEDKQDEQTGEDRKASDEGVGEDNFEFVLSEGEYLDFIFDDLELPDLVKKQMLDVAMLKSQRAGYTNQGNPSQLDIRRSLKNSLGRRIGLLRPSTEKITALEEEIENEQSDERKKELLLEMEQLKKKQKAIPWIDPFDVRYRNYTMVPKPTTQAVMFCIMDVSGSMGQDEKDISKRFFFLLHLFLKRKYQKVQIVFIRHHVSATEVDEDEFFNSRETGGTVVSTALKLTQEIIEKKYSPSDWNIFIAQCSDGDNFLFDNPKVEQYLKELLPITQYFAYIEIDNNAQLSVYNYSGKANTLWTVYKRVSKEFNNLATSSVQFIGDIWTVFRKIFQKEQKNA